MAEALVETRRGEWMCTASGRRYFPCDPRPEDVCIEDIAHHLAQENRFCGALPEPYSVGQHSVVVETVVGLLGGSLEERKKGLIHDSPEAYLKDLHRPLKRAIGGIYGELEELNWLAITAHLGLSPEKPEIVKRADDLALAFERRDLFPASHQQLWTLRALDDFGSNLRLTFWDWRQAKTIFLKRFGDLFNEPAGGRHG